MNDDEDIAQRLSDAEQKMQREAILVRRITTINAMAYEIGANATEKGFRDEWMTATAFDYWNPELPFTVPDGYADAMMSAVIASKLALIDSESAEALEALREVGAKGVLTGKSNFVEELADIVIRACELAEMVQGDLGAAVVDKMSKNKNRPRKHGGKKL